jgi:urease alpha subunit
MYENDLLKADINISTSGDNTIIAAPTYGYIAIDHINFVPTSAVTVQLKSGTTNYGGAYPLDTKQAFTIENATHNPKGVITCGSAEAFKINLGSAVQVSGFVRYRIVV